MTSSYRLFAYPLCEPASSCFSIRALVKAILLRKTKGGGNLGGRGKHTIKPLPKDGFGPPTYDTFSPPVCSRHVIFLRGNGHAPDQSHCLSPPKPGFGGHALYYVCATPKSHNTFRPPPPPTVSQILEAPICL